MATHSSVLAWRIPGTGEPGGLPSMGSHRVRHNWSDLAAIMYKAMVFPVVMYGCERWTVKKAEQWRIDAFELLEKTLESPLDCKEIQPVHPKGDQSWVFFGRTDGKAETPILWPPHAKSWLIGKDSDAEKDWRQKEKGTTEDEMAGWHDRLNGHEFEQAPVVMEREAWLTTVRGLAKSQIWLNWTELIFWSLIASRISYYKYSPQINALMYIPWWLRG